MNPVGQQCAKIEQRIAAGALVPVDHGDRRQVVRVQDHVVQLEVVVQKSGLAVRHDVAFQPAGDVLVQRFGAVLFRRPTAFDPTGDGTGQETFGPAKVVQTDCRGIDRMDRCDGFQQHIRQTLAEAGTDRQLGRNGFPNNQTRPVFENLKALAADRRIVAQVKAAWDKRQRIRQARQDTVLARHVVSAGGQLAHWRAAQHGGFAVEVNEIIQVGQPAGELARRRVIVQPHPMAREVSAHGRPVQFDAVLWRAKACVGRLPGHVSSYWLASGPGRSQY